MARRQLFFNCTATKRVWSPDLTRTSTALRPSFVASLMPIARSSGFFTARPPTSRITSPGLDALLDGVGAVVGSLGDRFSGLSQPAPWRGLVLGGGTLELE